MVQLNVELFNSSGLTDLNTTAPPCQTDFSFLLERLESTKAKECIELSQKITDLTAESAELLKQVTNMQQSFADLESEKNQHDALQLSKTQELKTLEQDYKKYRQKGILRGVLIGASVLVGIAVCVSVLVVANIFPVLILPVLLPGVLVGMFFPLGVFLFGLRGLCESFQTAYLINNKKIQVNQEIASIKKDIFDLAVKKGELTQKRASLNQRRIEIQTEVQKLKRELTMKS